MQIRHKKQWLTGKMIAQVRFGDGEWADAGYMHRVILNLSNDRLDSAQRLTSWETEAAMQVNKLQADCITRMSKDLHRVTGENETLRRQLSEALDKIKEYREAEERKIPQIMSVHVDKSKGFYALKIVDLATGKDVHWSNSVDEDTMYRNIPTVIRRILAKNGQIPSHYDNDRPSVSDELGTNAYPIPHHGPGLSAADDAFKADEVLKGDDGVTVQYRGEQVRMSHQDAASLREANERCGNPVKDPITGLVFNPDGWLRVLVQRRNGFLRVCLQIIDSGRIIGTGTGSSVEETLGRIIEPCERHDVREVVWDYHTLTQSSGGNHE